MWMGEYCSGNCGVSICQHKHYPGHRHPHLMSQVDGLPNVGEGAGINVGGEAGAVIDGGGVGKTAHPSY